MAIPEQDFLIEAAFSQPDSVWEIGVEVTFASGKTANNKADLERLFVNPEDTMDPYSDSSLALTEAGELIVEHLVERVDIGAPEAVAGVPTGGQRFAMVVGKRLEVPVIRFVKDINEPGIKTYKVENLEEEEKLKGIRRLAEIEDATTELGSLISFDRAIKNINPGIDLFAEAILRRGSEETERKLDTPIGWLIELPIPNIITPDHPTFQRWGHLAVRRGVEQTS